MYKTVLGLNKPTPSRKPFEILTRFDIYIAVLIISYIIKCRAEAFLSKSYYIIKSLSGNAFYGSLKTTRFILIASLAAFAATYTFLLIIKAEALYLFKYSYSLLTYLKRSFLRQGHRVLSVVFAILLRVLKKGFRVEEYLRRVITGIISITLKGIFESSLYLLKQLLSAAAYLINITISTTSALVIGIFETIIEVLISLFALFGRLPLRGASALTILSILLLHAYSDPQISAYYTELAADIKQERALLLRAKLEASKQTSSMNTSQMLLASTEIQEMNKPESLPEVSAVPMDILFAKVDKDKVKLLEKISEKVTNAPPVVEVKKMTAKKHGEEGTITAKLEAPKSKKKVTRKSSTLRYPSFPPDIINASTDRSEITLTFDGGAHSGDTMEILRILRKRGIKTTIFLTGRFIEQNPGLVKIMYFDGHEIANHTLTHSHLTDFSKQYRHITLPNVTKEFIQEELIETAAIYNRVTGREMAPLWRAPYGEVNSEIRAWALEAGFMHIGWTYDNETRTSLDTLDWVFDKKSRIYRSNTEMQNRIMKFANTSTGLDGGIVLMHLGTQRTTDKLVTKLPEIIDSLISRGYKIVKVSELIRGDSSAEIIMAHMRKQREEGRKLAMNSEDVEKIKSTTAINRNEKEEENL
ncbi:MAG: polysaccharide deacetylase family protein [Deltaproteobacteria bacterium]|nr:polysaccharide deacetylase family protein [Deltaproteobacteria bacterium]